MAVDTPRWQRRAQPWLGTLVEIGLPADSNPAAFDAAFAAVREVQSALSRFEPTSDVSRFNALSCGERLAMRPATRHVLAAARALFDATDGDFDITLGTSPRGWACAADQLIKSNARTHIDLGGIGKGHAVDCAVQALMGHGCTAGWVNAGGDLRAFGSADVPVSLRDEASGGVRPFASVRDAAFATSHFGHRTRSRAATRTGARALQAHVSVAAPRCLWADALTKVVAISGDTSHPLLARYDATAWLHPSAE